MRERLITLALALCALAAFYMLLAPKPAPRDTVTERPTSEESREDGYLAAHRWLQSTGMRVVSLRDRYDALADASQEEASPLSPTGNLLVVTLPYYHDARYRELQVLREWIEAGNTLLVLAALGDTPAWSASPALNPLPQLYQLADFTAESLSWPEEEEEAETFQVFDEPPQVVGQRLPEPLRMTLAPSGAHPLFAGVRRLAAETEYPADDWYPRLPVDSFVLTLAHEVDSPGEAFWLSHLGAGTVMVSAYASVFTNQLLGEQDNARLFANIVAQSVRPGGAVIFDDLHQGLSRLLHPEAFYSDGRLHATLWLLLALWLIWVLGGTRLRVLRAPPLPPGEAALVRATGGFLARALRPLEAARRMFELFFNDLRRRLGEPQNGTPLWGWLERRPQLAAADLAALRQQYERINGKAHGLRRVDLKRLHTLILRIQEQVT